MANLCGAILFKRVYISAARIKLVTLVVLTALTIGLDRVAQMAEHGACNAAVKHFAFTAERHYT